MVCQGGFGSTTSADSVKAVYQALFGVTGKTVNPKQSILRGGDVPKLRQLPVIAADGRILPPGSKVPRSAVVPVTPASPAAPSPSGDATPAAAAAIGAVPYVGDGRRSARARGGGT